MPITPCLSLYDMYIWHPHVWKLVGSMLSTELENFSIGLWPLLSSDSLLRLSTTDCIPYGQIVVEITLGFFFDVEKDGSATVTDKFNFGQQHRFDDGHQIHSVSWIDLL